MKSPSRLGNRIMGAVLRTGAPFAAMAVLTVSGRKTGLPRSTPVAVAPHQGGWRLLAVHGVGDWVRNLRTAGRATLTIRGTSIPVAATELDPVAAAPVIRTAVAEAGPVTRRIIGPHFEAAVDAPLEAWEQEATRHPVFHLSPRRLPRPRGATVLRVLAALLVLGVVAQVALAGAGVFGLYGAWGWHRELGVAVEAVALTGAVTAIVLRRSGVRWLTAGIFILIAFQHGTAAIGGVAGGIHAVNALLMLGMASIVLRRLNTGAPVPAAPHLTVGAGETPTAVPVPR